MRAAPQPQPAKREETGAASFTVSQFSSVCFNPKTDDCAGCGVPACKDHFDANTKRCSICIPRKGE
eukprot:5117444-Pyramimonas_sp.AAC.1